MHKVGKFDLLRATMHALGHLMGSHHDNLVNATCHQYPFSTFLNPFLMHPISQLNVGLRPNTMKISFCAKLNIAAFLNSNGLQCLEKDKDEFCGNGTYTLPNTISKRFF